MNKLILTEWRGDILTALWTDGKISRLSLDGRESPSLLNGIYIGKVKNVVKNIGAAFVEFGDGRIGYYSLQENREHLLTGLETPSAAPLKAGDELVAVSEDRSQKALMRALSATLP